jgi:hypothetical protein
MQLRPDQSTLLEAVAQFLLGDLLPNVTDKALAFKVMIAANLTTMVAQELRTDDDRYLGEVARLQALLPAVVPGDARLLSTHATRVDALTRLNAALAERLRANRFTPERLEAVTAHVRQTTQETLQATNPRFDLSADIE